MKTRILPLFILGILAAVGTVSAVPLVEFSFFGQPSGAKTNPFNTSIASNLGDVNVATNAALTAGLTFGAGATNGGTSNAWGGASLSAVDQTAAIAANDYYMLSLKADTGYTLSFTTINSKLFGSASSASAYIWRYSLDGVNFTDIGTAVTGQVFAANGTVQTAIDVSGISALQNVADTTTVTLRVYFWGASGASSSSGFGKSTSINDFSALNFQGTVGTAVPEPSTYALLGLGAGLIVFGMRRKLHKA